MKKEPTGGLPCPTERDDSGNPFRIDFSFKGRFGRKLLSPSTRFLERLFLLHHVEKLYSEARTRTGDGHFLAKFLQRMNITYQISGADAERIPKTGPVLVVANHPYGAIEAAILCVVLKSVRPDVKVLANYLLHRIPEVRDCCIFVDPFGSRKSKRVNVAPLKEATLWLRGGGMLGVFPAGEVSHISLRGRGIVDPRWNAGIGRIIRLAKATVLPIFIEGHNSPLFQIAGLIHPRIRTAMLPHELLNKRNRCIRLSVGNAMPFEKLGAFSTDSDLMDYLRFRTYLLENRLKPPKPPKRGVLGRRREHREEEIAPPEDPELMSAEIRRLPPDQILARNGDLWVCVANAEQIWHILHEIGRLREVTFRTEGEGTGRHRDLDRFDSHYMHLFGWNDAEKEIIGAYRLGRADEILRRLGKKGLYTSTLFRYKRRLLRQIQPALELGRSFVRPEYQRNFSSLLLLWKGIGQFIARHPQYVNLFGPVSISNEYRSVSRQLLAAFLKVNNFESGLAKLIRAKRPLRTKPIKASSPAVFSSALADMDTISHVIADIEGVDKGVPILLKQYLRLGGKLLGFNVDPDFGNVLDGLILVDLRHTDIRQIQRFMGEEGLEGYLAYHHKTRESWNRPEQGQSEPA